MRWNGQAELKEMIINKSLAVIRKGNPGVGLTIKLKRFLKKQGINIGPD
jgi:hypothetical protein